MGGVSLWLNGAEGVNANTPENLKLSQHPKKFIFKTYCAGLRVLPYVVFANNSRITGTTYIYNIE